MQVFTGTNIQTCVLPGVSAAQKQVFIIKNMSTGIVTVSRAGGDLIDGLANSILLNQYQSIMLCNDGVSNWYRI